MKETLRDLPELKSQYLECSRFTGMENQTENLLLAQYPFGCHKRAVPISVACARAHTSSLQAEANRWQLVGDLITSSLPL